MTVILDRELTSKIILFCFFLQKNQRGNKNLIIGLLESCNWVFSKYIKRLILIIDE